MPTQNEDRIERLKNEIDIVGLIGADVKLKKKGKIFQGLCPFHSEKTPSFTADPAKKKYSCYGCESHGDIFDYVQRSKNLSKHEAIDFLDKNKTCIQAVADLVPTVKKLNLSWLYEKQCSFNNRAVVGYFKSRGLDVSDNLIAAIGLKYNEYKDRKMLVYPLRDPSGKIQQLTRIIIDDSFKKAGKKEMLGVADDDRAVLILRDKNKCAGFEGLEDAVTYLLHSGTNDSVLVTDGKSGFGKIEKFTEKFSDFRFYLDNDKNDYSWEMSVNLPEAVKIIMPGEVGIDANSAHIKGEFKKWIDSAAAIQRPVTDAIDPTVAKISVKCANKIEIDLIKNIDWPDTRIVKKIPVPVSTIENLEYLLKKLGTVSRYNVISKAPEITGPDTVYTALEGGNNAAINDIISHACRHGLPKGDIPQYISSIAFRNHYNPVKEWITSKSYGREDDYIDMLCQTVTARTDFNPTFKDTLIRKWLLSCVAMACNDTGTQWSKGVLVFQGLQNVGKTSWFWKLLPEDHREWGIDALTVQPGKKDSETKAIMHWLVELGELEATFRKSDIALLKGFITSRKDTMRLSYDRRESVFPRRTAFFGSVNPEEFLHDETGNSRFWVVPVVHLDYKHEIDIQQMWAQVYELYQNGEEWFLNSEENEQLEKYNQTCMETHPIEEMILKKVPFMPGTEMTATEVLELLGYERPSRPDRVQCSSILKKFFGPPHNGRAGRKFNLSKINQNNS